MNERDDVIPADGAAEGATEEAPEGAEQAGENRQNDQADGETGGELLSDGELNEMIEHICNSKAEEFRMLGYEHVTGREVWDCVSDKYEKKGYPPLHQIVNDILSLKSTQFMNWMTMSIYRSAQS
ncbi:post-transcriptional regulator [Paenibacillus chartarius]|uniref:Post-transcriptional regulator n=1 Tax=Paenibacillus chartarius TaxID=747481 RepID=A0ABV6DIV7_9BACL